MKPVPTQAVHLYQDMIGKVFESVTCSKSDLTFLLKNLGEGNNSGYRFCHEQCCCERVFIYDIIGDLKDLEGSPLLMAEEVSQDIPDGWTEPTYDSFTWTFYKFATAKGYVTVRWLGTSNGYYSERVQFYSFPPKPRVM